MTALARAAALALVLSSCRTFEPAKVPEGALVELSPADFPRFTDDLAFAGLAPAIDQSLAYFGRLVAADPKRTAAFGPERIPLAKIAASLERFRELVASGDASAVDSAIRREFRVFRSTGNDSAGNVLFTGYYLPELNGAFEKDASHPVPLYGVPPELVTVRAKHFPQLEGDLVGRLVDGELRPLPTREQIAKGALEGKAPAVAWVDSAVDAFFLEIQGSGILRLADGSTRVVTYAGKNGHKYVAIGGELARRGVIAREALSMQSIRAWLVQNPGEAQALMNANPSFVFFRASDAPQGSIGVPVTAGRSIATDKKVFPAGALSFIATERPADATGDAWIPFGRFVLDQDTGGAIRTAGRVDVYWGSGPYAAQAAGRMKQNGFLYYLVLR